MLFNPKTFIFFLISPQKQMLWYSVETYCQNTSYEYRIYPKYSDTSTPYHILCTKIWTSTIHYPMLCLKIAGWVANSVDPDETPCSAASHLGLYCLLRPVCPNIYGKYGTHKIWFCGEIRKKQCEFSLSFSLVSVQKRVCFFFNQKVLIFFLFLCWKCLGRVQEHVYLEKWCLG